MLDSARSHSSKESKKKRQKKHRKQQLEVVEPVVTIKRDLTVPTKAGRKILSKYKEQGIKLEDFETLSNRSPVK